MNKLKVNIAYNIIYQILLIISPLLTAPYLSRVLGADGIGLYSYSYSIANYFILFGMLGIVNYGNRNIALNSGNKKKQESIFAEIYTLQLFTTFLAFDIYVVFVLLNDTIFKEMLIIHSINVFSAIFDVNWLFFGLEKFKLTVVRNIVVKILTIMSIFILVKDDNDLIIYTGIMACGTLISQLWLWIRIRKEIKFKIPNFDHFWKNFKSSLVLFLPILAYSIYKIMDKIMLGNMSDMVQVGYYENSEKFINIPLGFINAIGTVMMPRISVLKSTQDNRSIKIYNELSFKYFSIMIVACVSGLFSVSKVLVPVFYGEEFAYCSLLIAALSFTLIFITWANIIRTQYLIPQRRDAPYIVSTMVGAVVNFTINYLLIPRLASMGAVIGTIAAEASVFFVQAIWIRKEFSVFHLVGSSLKYFVYGGIMAIFVLLIGKINGEGVYTLIIQICIGGLVYSILICLDLYYEKDPFFLKCIKEIYNRIRNL